MRSAVNSNASKPAGAISDVNLVGARNACTTTRVSAQSEGSHGIRRGCSQGLCHEPEGPDQVDGEAFKNGNLAEGVLPEAAALSHVNGETENHEERQCVDSQGVADNMSVENG